MMFTEIELVFRQHKTNQILGGSEYVENISVQMKVGGCFQLSCKIMGLLWSYKIFYMILFLFILGIP